MPESTHKKKVRVVLGRLDAEGKLIADGSLSPISISLDGHGFVIYEMAADEEIACWQITDVVE